DPLLEKQNYENLFDDELSTAISSLPEDFRIVLILCDIEGFTYDEIADFVDVPVGTVRSRLNRARKMLFTKLYKYAGDKEYLTEDKK
ncbi:MAG: sigma-70 family RNA polymerase sigma factor, partial [Ignavibacteria bacterium]|nr:sigma-70 family RNA polymerase sigma factor [Ignavibacteria bacterium]